MHVGDVFNLGATCSQEGDQTVAAIDNSIVIFYEFGFKQKRQLDLQVAKAGNIRPGFFFVEFYGLDPFVSGIKSIFGDKGRGNVGA